MDYKKVAEWMYEELKRNGILYQEEAIYGIMENFGEEYTHLNENGNPAIDRKVLKEFRKLTDETVVWVRSEKCWRFREEGDENSRMQNG
jgi:hypothetical protein